MDNTTDKTTDKTIYEYTIVLDGDYLGTNESEEKLGTAVERHVPEAAPDGQTSAPENTREAADKLYSDYEKMIFRDPNVLDKDDAYPHTYQWRIADRYDPAKIEVIEAALKSGVKITDTEEYLRYSEEMASRRFMPDSWD